MSEPEMKKSNSDKLSKNAGMISGAFAFIVIMGIVSLFSDMTHEGARSVLGDFLKLNGASAARIGFISGLGELLGYGLRIISGRLADKTKRYWTLVIVGYAVQVLAIPALALVPENGWMVAFGLVLMERIGKGIKKPAKNTLVSFASAEIGQGKGFAFMEFLDQLGAFLGPVILYLISRKPHDFNEKNGAAGIISRLLGITEAADKTVATYRICFLILGIPALITVALVIFAKIRYPHPETFEKKAKENVKFRFRKSFAYYMIAICLFAFGFVDFTIITVHAANTGAFGEKLSLLYALAMAVDAFAALFFGWLFDKIGLRTLMISTLVSSTFAAFVFFTQRPVLIILGVVIWGIGMGAQESIMKAAVSKIIPANMRSTGFGIFETGFGVFWWLGSWILGRLYDQNMIIALVTVSAATQLSAIVFYYLSVKTDKNDRVAENRVTA